MSVDPVAALRAASAPGPAPARTGVRRLLVAGAVGRLGEALLNDALARGGYEEVVALADGDAAMSLGVRGLSLAPLERLPPLADVCVAQTVDPDAPGARSFHGRDAPLCRPTTCRASRGPRPTRARGASCSCTRCPPGSRCPGCTWA